MYKEQLKLRKVGDEDCATIMLHDCLGEYDLETLPGKWDLFGVKVKEIANAFEIGEVLEDAGIIKTGDYEKERKYIRKVFQKRMEYPKEHSNALVCGQEEILENPGTLYMVEFYSKWDIDYVIADFADALEVYCRGIVETAGGDDDYYDYVPGFVDMFRQFCEMFKLDERYNRFVKKLDSDWVEEAIYVNELYK